MSDQERVIVRWATMQDLGLFKRLWQAYLEEQHSKGDLVLPNEHNLAISAEMFKSYVGGDVLGMVHFLNVNGKDVGVHMGGVVPGGFELSIGKYTSLRGVYVEPEYRRLGFIKILYADKITSWMKKHDIGGTVTSVLTGDTPVSEVLENCVSNKIMAGEVKPFMVVMYWEFNKEQAS